MRIGLGKAVQSDTYPLPLFTMSCLSISQRCVGKGKPPGPPPGLSAEHGADDLGHKLLRKVLIVDDEAELAELAAVLLNAHGLETLTANSAQEAMRILATQGDIDAVVSDIVMPGMTGLELADAIGAMYPTLKVVLTSGFTLPGKLAERERAYLFAPKPYRVETLLKLLRS